MNIPWVNVLKSQSVCKGALQTHSGCRHAVMYTDRLYMKSVDIT